MLRQSPSVSQDALTTRREGGPHQNARREARCFLQQRKRAKRMLQHEKWYSLIVKRLRRESKNVVAEPLPER
jgi:hypothetical protein